MTSLEAIDLEFVVREAMQMGSYAERLQLPYKNTIITKIQKYKNQKYKKAKIQGKQCKWGRMHMVGRCKTQLVPFTAHHCNNQP